MWVNPVCRLLGFMDATVIPSKSFSTQRPTIAQVISQISPRIFKETRNCTPMTSSKHPQISGRSTSGQLILQISGRITPHRSTHWSQISLTTSSTTVCLEIAHPLRRTQLPHALWDLLIPIIIYHSILRTFDPTQRQIYLLLTRSGHLVIVHQT